MQNFLYSKEYEYEYNVEIAANTYNDSNYYDAPLPDGYKAIAAVIVHSGGHVAYPFGIECTDLENATRVKMYLRNTTDHSISIKPKFRIIYCKQR